MKNKKKYIELILKEMLEEFFIEIDEYREPDNQLQDQIINDFVSEYTEEIMSI